MPFMMLTAASLVSNALHRRFWRSRKEEGTSHAAAASDDRRTDVDCVPQTFPALYGLYQNDFLPEGIHIIGYARTKMDEAEFHKRASQHIKVIPALKKKVDEFLGDCTYISGQYDSDEDFQNLTKHLEEIEKKYSGDEVNRVFYMALPPSVFTIVAEKLKKNCYTDKGTNRIIVEKPFGKDLESSREMMGKLKALWSEDEVRGPIMPKIDADSDSADIPN